MASITALQLVNRVMSLRRQPTVAAFLTPEDTATLNAVNMAIEDILDAQKFDFDIRHDGQLTLIGRLDDVTATVFEGTTSAVLTRSTLPDSSMIGDFVTRLLMDGSTDASNTSLVIVSSPGTVGLGSHTVVLASNSTSSQTSVSAELHYAEYLLPDTVKAVIRAGYQEQELNLKQVDPVLRYDELFPSQSKLGPPEKIAVGGFDLGTYTTGASNPEPKLRLAVWPVPDDDYTVNYSYYYRHPQLSTITDVLVGVPTSSVNDIVMMATSTMIMSWDKDYAGAHFTDLAESRSFRKNAAFSGNNARRRPVSSFESGSSNSLRIERGFPNRTIG